VTTGESDGGGPTVRRMALGGQLRRLRESRGISREDAAERIRGSASKISRLELGKVSIKPRDVTDLLTLYGVVDEAERDAFLQLAKQSNQPGWWHRYNDLMPRWFQDYVGLEEAVARIQTYEVLFVPGLVQTPRYAHAVVREGIPDASDDEVHRRVTLRMQRQRLLTQPRMPRLWAVMDESVLRRFIGGRQVLHEQLEHLLEVSRLPNVSLQVVPLLRGRFAAEGPFSILRFAEPELPDVVYLEHLCGAMYLDKPEEVELYSKVTHRLAVDAQTPDETRATIGNILRDI